MEKFEYVPLIDNLQWLLQNSDVHDEVSILLVYIYTPKYKGIFIFLQVFKIRTSHSEYMYDFCDGQIYNQHPLFSGDDRALQLVVYTDEVETANPLGSYRGHYKLSKVHSGSHMILFIS